MVLSLYYACGMTEPKIEELLGNLGILISAGQISNLLVKEKQAWHEEKSEVVQAGLASTTWQHIDDTGTRVNGENQHCHILCNPFYTAYFTEPHKDRLTVIRVLQGGAEASFLFNEETTAWLGVFNLPLKAQRQIALWPQAEALTAAQLDALLMRDLSHLNQQQHARIREAAALTAYHQQRDLPIVEQLLSDDAPQFQHVTAEQELCWVHEGRHYQKLSPFVEYHQQLLAAFRTQFWAFYHKLRDYRETPDSTQAQRLSDEFDSLFSTVTGYHELDKRIAKTNAHKDKLLLVLHHPELPLHNNPAELGARQRVRKRDISFGPRTDDGVKAWDTFMTLTETAKKLGVNFYSYLHDRVSGSFSLPSLASLIRARSAGEQQALVSD
jgi:Transposase IS66 family